MTYRLSGRLLNKGLMGAVAALLLLMSLLAPARAELVQFIYTSDQHYGITRKAFRGLDKVSSREVNAAMVQAINTLPGISLPEDGGVRAGQPVQWADAVISTGDIANRMEETDERLIPSATECWDLFEKQYINGVSLKDRAGKAAEVLAIPGNHDVTNAVGFYKAMTPAKDNGSLLAMYNRANNTSLAPEAFDAKRDKVFLNREYGGVRLLFVQMWPDSAPTISRILKPSTSSIPTVPETSTPRTSSRIWFPTCPAFKRPRKSRSRNTGSLRRSSRSIPPSLRISTATRITTSSTRGAARTTTSPCPCSAWILP